MAPLIPITISPATPKPLPPPKRLVSQPAIKPIKSQDKTIMMMNL
jgi:hypothetical protein